MVFHEMLSKGGFFNFSASDFAKVLTCSCVKSSGGGTNMGCWAKATFCFVYYVEPVSVQKVAQLGMKPPEGNFRHTQVLTILVVLPVSHVLLRARH